MITGRRSMDKNRPSGEHNLVEWARPFLSDKRKAFRLVDHRLDRQVPMKGLQKALSLANACLSRDAKCRPLMSEVVSTLEPLQLVKDAQGGFYYHQTINGLKDRIRPNGGDSQNRHPSYQSNHQIPQNGLTRLNGGTNGRPFEQMPKQPSKG